MGKLWRVKRRGKFIGSFRVTIKGREINLDTKDATEALRRAKLAARGLWPQEQNAAVAVAAAFDSEPPQDATPPFAVPAGDGASTAGPVAAEPTSRPSIGDVGAPLIPDVMPSGNWAADAGAAAAEDAGARPAGEPSATPLPNIGLEALIDMGAPLLVDLQLELQAFVIRRWKHREAPQIAPGPMHKAAGEIWRQQLRIWLPKDIALPPWVLAVGSVAIMGCAQYQLSTPIEKKPAGAAGV